MADSYIFRAYNGDYFHLTFLNPDSLKMTRGEPTFVASGVVGKQISDLSMFKYAIDEDNKLWVLRGRVEKNILKTDAFHYDYDFEGYGERNLVKLKNDFKVPHWLENLQLELGKSRNEKVLNALRKHGNIYPVE